MTLPSRKPATYSDILALPEHVIGEILDGELVVSSHLAPRLGHAATAALAELSPFCRRTGEASGMPGGWWAFFGPELHLGPHVLVPDLAGWRRERMPSLPDTAWFEMPPDWVCEVISPSSSRRDRIQKARIYRECLVEWLWLVDPLAQTVEVMHAETGRWVVMGGWEGEDAQARMPPFDAMAIDLARWWDSGE